MLEDIPRHGPGLAVELRKAGSKIKAKAEKELAGLYPKDPDGGHAHRLPLGPHRVLRGPQLCGRDSPHALHVAVPQAKRKWALHPTVAPAPPRHSGESRNPEPPRVEFEIFQPRADSEVANGTVSRARATCPAGGRCCRRSEYVPTCRPARRRRRGIRRTGRPHRRRANDRSSHRHARPAGTPATACPPMTTTRRCAWPRSESPPSSTSGAGGRQGLCPVPDEPTPLVEALGPAGPSASRNTE